MNVAVFGYLNLLKIFENIRYRHLNHPRLGQVYRSKRIVLSNIILATKNEPR